MEDTGWIQGESFANGDVFHTIILHGVRLEVFNKLSVLDPRGPLEPLEIPILVVIDYKRSFFLFRVVSGGLMGPLKLESHHWKTHSQSQMANLVEERVPV